MPPQMPVWIFYLRELAPVIGPLLGFLGVVIAALIGKW